MDALSSFNASSWLWIATAVVVGAALAATMGFFDRKNHMPVEGRTVLLTGATEGLGRSAARQLSAQGANVIIVSRNVSRLEETIAEVRAAAKSPHSQRFHYISADVSQPDYAAAVLADATTWNNGAAPDIVWCVAGMATPLLWIEDERTLAATRRNMDVNFFGAAEMAHAILRVWTRPSAKPAGGRAQPKHIIFTASVAASIAIAGYGPYSPSKWALRGLADTLAMEVKLYPDTPIDVHIVYPGGIDSPGLARENVTKPGVTLELEKAEGTQSPDEVATKSIAGLQAGKFGVPVSLTGELVRCGTVCGSPRNNSLLDTLVGLFVPAICLFILMDMNSTVSGWAKKYGHPSTYAKKQ